MTRQFMVKYRDRRIMVTADDPEEAARRAVHERIDHADDVFGVEVSVFERVLTRHDVIVGEVEP